MKVLLLLTLIVLASAATKEIKLTTKQVGAVFPKITGSKLESYTKHINDALKVANINTKLRVAHFLSQIGHESGGLQWFKEFASGSAYEGRKDLGNTHPGDGVRFKGRGPIQITGRANYQACGKALGVDFISHPELLEQPKYAFKGAAWFWKTRNINASADKDNIRAVTKIINGGYNGLSSRQAYLNQAKKTLGLK